VSFVKIDGTYAKHHSISEAPATPREAIPFIATQRSRRRISANIFVGMPRHRESGMPKNINIHQHFGVPSSALASAQRLTIKVRLCEQSEPQSELGVQPDSNVLRTLLSGLTGALGRRIFAEVLNNPLKGETDYGRLEFEIVYRWRPSH
jgi:hypothetical protein